MLDTNPGILLGLKKEGCRHCHNMGEPGRPSAEVGLSQRQDLDATICRRCRKQSSCRQGSLVGVSGPEGLGAGRGRAGELLFAGRGVWVLREEERSGPGGDYSVGVLSTAEGCSEMGKKLCAKGVLLQLKETSTEHPSRNQTTAPTLPLPTYG